jgi:hypothetical protein
VRPHRRGVPRVGLGRRHLERRARGRLGPRLAFEPGLALPGRARGARRPRRLGTYLGRNLGRRARLGRRDELVPVRLRLSQRRAVQAAGRAARHHQPLALLLLGPLQLQLQLRSAVHRL